MFSSGALAQDQNPVILLTGLWTPSGQILKPWSPNPSQNPEGWIGEDWEGLGYDVKAFFPEFTDAKDKVGQGDFAVDQERIHESFDRLTRELSPIAIISFGRKDQHWTLEVNAPDRWFGSGEVLRNSLPVRAIRSAVNRIPELRSNINFKGDAGKFLCGFLSYLGARYHEEHSNPDDPAWNIAQGFIHIKNEVPIPVYQEALKSTLRTTIHHLDQTRSKFGKLTKKKARNSVRAKSH